MDGNTVQKYRLWLVICVFFVVILAKIMIQTDNIIIGCIAGFLIAPFAVAVDTLRLILRNKDKL